MLCVNPYRVKDGEFGCGKCLPCKFAKRRIWVSRLLLELHCHRHSCFVTLTYKEDQSGWSGEHIRMFLQKVRRRIGPVRYLCVGERGKKFGRIHYHMALYGVSVARVGDLRASWGHGFVDVGELNGKSAAYLVKYLLKEVSDEKPFRRMSNKPGIGGLMVAQVAAKSGAVLASGVIDDVPCTVRFEGREYALGRYIRAKARVALGREGRTPLAVRERQSAEYAAECPVLRERKRENGYVSAQARLLIMRSKERL